MMRYTTDTYTGRRFAWNTTARVEDEHHGKLIVPARESRRGFVWLHPTRVPFPLLRELNPDESLEREGS
jgi:hypothetical protein